MLKFLIILFLCFDLCIQVSRAEENRGLAQKISRVAFSSRMSKIQRGMTKLQVQALLGVPDAIEGNSWLYGVTGNSTCPTAGSVRFDNTNHVLYAAGSVGKPPSEKLISEKELRYLLTRLWDFGVKDSGSFVNADNFDPLAAIKIVNLLQPYGKERVLSVAHEYSRVCDRGEEGVLVLLRILFDPDEKHPSLPQFSPGPRFPPVPLNKRLTPRFPIVMVGDVPIFIVYGRPFGSYPSDGTDKRRFLDYLERYGRIRNTALCPVPDPFRLLDKLASSDQWLFGKTYPTDGPIFPRDLKDEETVGRNIVRLQLLRLIRTLLPESSPYRTTLFSDDAEINQEEWESIRKDLSDKQIRWDPNRNEYSTN